MDIITFYLAQIASTVVLIFGFGILVALLNRLFYSNFGTLAKPVCYITGCIGTPIHELSHALMCLLFGHRITEIKLYQISSDDGTLGYVKHSFNRKNIYHQIGNFFIGVAPILVISTLLYFLLGWIVPDLQATINDRTIASGFNIGVGEVLKGMLSTVVSVFQCFAVPQFYLFLLIGFFLTPHMTLSKADIKGAWMGLVFLLVVLLIVDITLYFVSLPSFVAFSGFIFKAGSFLLNFFIISLIICLIEVAISFLFLLIVRKKGMKI